MNACFSYILIALLVTAHAPRAAELGKTSDKTSLKTVLFIGSSTIANWSASLQNSFPDVHAVSEGRGGTNYTWLIDTARQSVLKHNPDRIVIYSGDNDLAQQVAPETVAKNFERTVELIRGIKPESPIYVFSIKPAPGRRELLEQVKATNALIKAAAGRLHKVYYVDVFSRMISERGEISEENFDPADPMHIHLSPTGYALWSSILTSYFRRER